ncbi:cytosolic thiouridylase subunit Ctu1, partial [Blyttiomyces sp. JEL0837]
CIYSPFAYRGYARAFLKDLEKIRPSAIMDIIHSGEAYQVKEGIVKQIQSKCERCGFMSSNKLCKACLLLEGLNKGLPKSKIMVAVDIEDSKSSKVTESETVVAVAADVSLEAPPGSQLGRWGSSEAL